MNDVRTAQQLGALILLPFGAVYLLTELRVSEIDKLSAVDDERQIRAALDTFLARVQQQLAELSNVLTAAYFQKGDAIHQLVRMYPESRR